MPEDRKPPIAFDTTCTVAAPPEVVYAHLADPRSYIGLSPLIVAVDEVRHGHDAEGRAVAEYLAVERFRLVGPVRWDNRIRVRMVSTPPHGPLVSQVRSPGWVSLRAVVTLTAGSAGTRVHERVTADAPAPLRRFVAGEARRVAAYRAAELTRRMAAR
ncbi:SRPBCC family protein [Verrucosispora sp. WMMA2121]|uniref:SRPBCC family protein n=1 Tax=Verrucosispora sp. WMMA2121 TaxID=3015164 RepID=UPI0022B6789C|nr:SRPBCC family protein [Verrucosispora sp. WMMA2121]MCZ7419981.1 SRPBCC family protein [Verrucosispora sp. WMMA2121]